MKRIAIAVAVFALVAGAAFAQCPAADTTADTIAQAGPRGMGRGQGPGQMHAMEGMMPGGMTALAVYEGNIYVLDGNVLKKLAGDMTELRSIELDIECYGPMQGGQGAGMHQGMQGRGMRGGQMQGQRPRQGMQAGQGRQMGGMMQGQRSAGMGRV